MNSKEQQKNNISKAQYSVLMSVYYKENPLFFEMAIKSMIEQTVPPNEFVLVCDGELTDELNSVIKRFQEKFPALFSIIRLKENKGLGIALAEGVKACKNEFVARMDSDDIAVPERIELQMQKILQDSEISIVGGQIAEFCDSVSNIVGCRQVPCEQNEIKEKLAFRNPMNHVTVLFRKSHVLKVGNYKDLPGYEDYYLWARMLEAKCSMCNLDKVLCYVRVGDAMYQRRGGMTYLKNAVILQQKLMQLKLIGKGQFVRNICVRFMAIMLLPNKVRGMLFKKLMRQKYIGREEMCK